MTWKYTLQIKVSVVNLCTFIHQIYIYDTGLFIFIINPQPLNSNYSFPNIKHAVHCSTFEALPDESVQCHRNSTVLLFSDQLWAEWGHWASWLLTPRGDGGWWLVAGPPAPVLNHCNSWLQWLGDSTTFPVHVWDTSGSGDTQHYTRDQSGPAEHCNILHPTLHNGYYRTPYNLLCMHSF